MKIDDLVYVAFNRRVAALEKRTGALAWTWLASQGSSYVAALLDGENLFVSVNGYTYCLDALTGEERWRNELKGHGTGAPMLVSSAGHSDPTLLARAAQQAAQAAAIGAASGS